MLGRWGAANARSSGAEDEKIFHTKIDATSGGQDSNRWICLPQGGALAALVEGLQGPVLCLCHPQNMPAHRCLCIPAHSCMLIHIHVHACSPDTHSDTCVHTWEFTFPFSESNLVSSAQRDSIGDAWFIETIILNFYPVL